MRWGRIICGAATVLASLGMAVAPSATLAQAPVASNSPSAGSASEVPHTHPKADIAGRLLALQNAERARLGLTPLVWSQALAQDAGTYARHLLDLGTLEHSKEASHEGEGENLWMGTAGAFDPESMIAMFLEERRYFRSAPFPNVSLTGNWTDVGHYSQIVWKETKEVGCALETARGSDVLVCRYFPAGNVRGKAPL